MTVLDIILIAALVWAVYNGAKKGFFVQLGGIVGVVIGIWLAFRFSDRVGVWLGIEGGIAWYVGFALIVLVCIAALGILGWLSGKVFHLVGLGILNRLGGIILSLAKTVLILGALLMAFQAINRHANIVNNRQFEQSMLCGPIVRTTNTALPFLKKTIHSIDFLRDNE